MQPQEAGAAEAADGPVPVYDLPKIEPVRPKRSYYDESFEGRAMVIDNGSYQCRVGWAGELEPRAAFRAVGVKARLRQENVTRWIIGERGPGLKGWEFKGPRDAFDGPVVTNWECQEAILDWGFDRMGITGTLEAHPVMITEPLLNPPSARASMAELLFESYGIPAVRFTSGGVAAFAYNKQQGRVGGSDGSGIVVDCGHSSTTIVPIVRGVPQLGAAFRTSVCGSLANDYMQRRLALRHPQHTSVLTPANCSALRERWCYCAADYRAELAGMQAQPETSGGKAIRIQLPWVPPKLPTAAEEAAEAAKQEERYERMRAQLLAMSAKQRFKRMEEKDAQLSSMEAIFKQLESMDPASPEAVRLLEEAGASSVAQLERTIQLTRLQVVKLKAQAAAEGQISADQVPEMPTEWRGVQLGCSRCRFSEYGCSKCRPAAPTSMAPPPPPPQAPPPAQRPTAAATAPAQPMEEEEDAAADEDDAAMQRGSSEPAEQKPKRPAAEPGVLGCSRCRFSRNGCSKCRGDEQPAVDLLNVPDWQLDEQQMRQKKRQKMMQAAQAAREQAAARRAEKERLRQLEHERHAADPEGYAAELRKRHAAVLAKINARMVKRVGTGPGGRKATAAGMGSRRSRVGAEQRYRMKLLAEAAFGSGSESDEEKPGFGANDEDWQVYREVDPDASDSGEDEADQRELRWTSSLMQELGISELPPSEGPVITAADYENGPSGSPTPAPAGIISNAAVAMLPGLAQGMLEDQIRLPIAEDHQLFIGVERIQVPELFFQPSLAGIDQAGLPELIMACIRRLPKDAASAVVAGGLLLTGGHASYPGLVDRLTSEITACLPLGKPMPVVAAVDMPLDAWRGAAAMAAPPGVFAIGGQRGRQSMTDIMGASGGAAAFTKRDYEEKGLGYLSEIVEGPFYMDLF